MEPPVTESQKHSGEELLRTHSQRWVHQASPALPPTEARQRLPDPCIHPICTISAAPFLLLDNVFWAVTACPTYLPTYLPTHLPFFAFLTILSVILTPFSLFLFTLQLPFSLKSLILALCYFSPPCPGTVPADLLLVQPGCKPGLREGVAILW